MNQTDHSQSSNASESESESNTRVPRHRATRLLWVIPLFLAIVLAAALYEQNRQYQALQANFQSQSKQNAQQVLSAHQQATQALDQVRGHAAEIRSLHSALDAISNQLDELDQALQMVSDSGSDLLLLNDIDHLVTIAQQQLALGGNVANAIISLEAAQAQLARANRPNLAALQQSINGDLDRLRAVATVNLPALSGQIDQLSDLLALAPLLIADTAVQPDSQTDQPAPVAQAGSSVSVSANPQDQASSADTAAWRRMALDGWQWLESGAVQLAQDLRGLIEVRRVDDAAALLISPEQALQFREGLKQRAVTAQLALMMHQSRIWKTELSRIAQAVDQRYDMRAETSRQALALARALHDTPIEITLPTVDNSLAAIAAVREAQADAQDAAAPAAAPEGVDTHDSGSTAPEAPPASSGIGAD